MILTLGVEFCHNFIFLFVRYVFYSTTTKFPKKNIGRFFLVKLVFLCFFCVKKFFWFFFLLCEKILSKKKLMDFGKKNCWWNKYFVEQVFSWKKNFWWKKVFWLNNFFLWNSFYKKKIHFLVTTVATVTTLTTVTTGTTVTLSHR